MALENIAASTLCGFAKLLTGVRAVWLGNLPDKRPRVYFANYRSHGDFVLIWASLPPHHRRRTRPVVAGDYWRATALRRYIADKVFHGVFVERKPAAEQSNPIELMGEVLTAGDSLIIFPEGTRNMGEELLPFKSGIYRLAQAHPEAELVTVWIENLGRVMPKGILIPVPLLCSLTFGPSLSEVPNETSEAFLKRARDALQALAPLTD